MDKDIVILAISEKNDNYCVAGIDINTGDWVRPYSDIKNINGAVPKDNIICDNGKSAKIFDIVRIKFEQPCNNLVQPENFYYNQSKRWRYLDSLTLHKTVLIHDFDYRDIIFFNKNRRLVQSEIDAVNKKESLLMLYVTNLEVIVKISDRDNHKQFRLNFDCEGVHYSEFAIGDIAVRAMYQDKPKGHYKFCDKAIIVFSLTDKFRDDRYYKMAAQFIIWK